MSPPPVSTHGELEAQESREGRIILGVNDFIYMWKGFAHRACDLRAGVRR